MRRGVWEATSDVLTEVMKNPQLAPSRIYGIAGVNYGFLQMLIKNGVLEVVDLKRKRKTLIMTEKGRVFYESAKTCRTILNPETCLTK